MELNPKSPMPLYQQFKVLVERKIASGEWPPGQLVPPESELIASYGISRTTVRQALDDLVKEGRIHRHRGIGTYVAPPKIAETHAQLTGFAEELQLRGMNPAIAVLEYQTQPASDFVAEILRVHSGSPILHIRRLVSVDGLPLFVDDSHFPPETAVLLGREQIEQRPIYQLLEAGGRSPSQGDQRLSAVVIDEETARLLGVQPGAAGLAIARTTTDALGNPLEHTLVVYRGDRYEYGIHLQRFQ